jgi:Sulfotransferase domain
VFILYDIVSLSAFPKSGVTYLSFLLFHSLFPNDCDIHDLERKYIIDIHAYPHARFANPQGPRLIKSHFPYNPDLPAIQLTRKAIYLIRHPIDVMMSAWDFDRLIKGAAHDAQTATFHAYVRSWIETGGTAFPEFGSWVQHVRSWLGQSTIPVHIVSYQDLVDSPDYELASILDFIGIQVPSERQRIAIDRSSMKSMAAIETQEVENKIDGIFFRNSLSAGYDIGRRFINKGYRNSYENILSVEERAIADKTFGTELVRYFGSSP